MASQLRSGWTWETAVYAVRSSEFCSLTMSRRWPLTCLVRDTGVNAIESLMEKKGKFDYILLETTGLADPGNIAPMFWMDDGLGSTIYLDGIVTLVDAKNILRNLDDPAGKVEGHDDGEDAHGPVMTTAHVQISHADVIII